MYLIFKWAGYFILPTTPNRLHQWTAKMLSK